MILVDTSVWVEFLRQNGDMACKREVASLVDLDEAAYTCPIFFELLSGASKREESYLREVFSLCPCMFFGTLHWERSAVIERGLRKKGVTVPRDDIFVAAVAEQENVLLLCRDKHFDFIRDTLDLRLQIRRV